MTLKSRLRVVAVFTLIIAATVPSRSAEKPKQRQSLGGAPSEERIVHEVRHELAMLPYYTMFDNLEYKVEGSKVILMGQVTQPRVKSDAEASVKKIEGVDSVENRIEVLPPSPDDDRIRLAEYRTISAFDGLYRYFLGNIPSIHIIVKNGHVTLVGVVDNEADKNAVGIQANSVPGVFSVENKLQVADAGSK